MRLLILLLLLVGVGCKRAATESEKTKALPEKDYVGIDGPVLPENRLPQEVGLYLDQHLPHLRLPDTADYVRSWWSFYDRDQIPYFVTTDINDDQAADYAFILKDAKAVRLVILLSSSTSFTHYVADDFSPAYPAGVDDIHFGLTAEPPAQIDALDRSLLLRSNGFTLRDMEEKFRVYYWANGKIEVFELDLLHS